MPLAFLATTALMRFSRYAAGSSCGEVQGVGAEHGWKRAACGLGTRLASCAGLHASLLSCFIRACGGTAAPAHLLRIIILQLDCGLAIRLGLQAHLLQLGRLRARGVARQVEAAAVRSRGGRGMHAGRLRHAGRQAYRQACMQAGKQHSRPACVHACKRAPKTVNSPPSPRAPLPRGSASAAS